MVRWTDLAPWEFEFPFPGSLTSTFLGPSRTCNERAEDAKKQRKREWFLESRRCSRDTYPDSYITKYILIYEDKIKRETG